MYQALIRIHELNNIKYFLIIPDFLSLVTALTTLTVKFKSNYILYFIKQIIHQYHIKNIQTFCLWVPSHKGTSGNEMADKAAYEGVNAVDVKNTMNVPMSDYLQCIDQNTQKLWLEM